MDALLDDFVEQYNDRFSVSLVRARCTASDGKYKVRGGRYLPTAFDDLADVFVVVDEPQDTKNTTSETKDTTRRRPEKKQEPKKAAAAAALPKKSTPQTASPDQARLIARFKRAMEVQKTGRLKDAFEAYADVAKAAAQRSGDPALRQLESLSIEYMASIYLLNKKHTEARRLLRPLDKQGASLRTLFLLGRAFHGLDDMKSALGYLSRAESQIRGDDRVARENRRDVQVWMARCLYAMDSVGPRSVQAIRIYESVLSQDPSNAMATVQYAAIAADRGKAAEAIPHVLQTLIACSKSPQVDREVFKAAKDLFADIIARPGMVNALLKHIAGAAGSPAALAYLANIAKDHSLLEQSAELTRKAVAASERAKDGSFYNLWLGYVHLMELDPSTHQDAFEGLVSCLEKHPTRGVKSVLNRDVASILRSVKTLRDPEAKGATPVPDWVPIGRLFDEGQCRVRVPGVGAATDAKLKCRSSYKDAELDLLALWFTAAKLLYLHGALAPIPALVRLIEPLRVDQDLHLTVIRNEHAYYCCVAQLVARLKAPLTRALPASEQDRLYFCADSHSLAPAWRRVRVGGRDRIIVPRLVTGLKCWHLRPGSRFFPKRNFESVVRGIPNGSTVIFNFGEIDCREGILLAVAKFKYASLEEGIARSVDIYIGVLERLARDRHFRVLVHPIVPVLDATRETVKKFNAQLQRAVGRSSCLEFLDFFDELLTPDKKGFNEAFALDGTHLSPDYVQLIQKAIGRLSGEEGKEIQS